MYGQYVNLIKELKLEDVGQFKNFVRVIPVLFMELLEKVGPLIQKQDTRFRKALPAGLWRASVEPGAASAITDGWLKQMLAD